MALTRVSSEMQEDDGAAILPLDTEYDADTGTITVLASGQSNAIGRDQSGNKTIDSRVTVWNNVNDLDDGTSLGTAFISPNFAAAPFVNSANNFAVHFCSRLAKVTGRNVRLLLVAKGATTSEGWWDGGSDGPMTTRIKAVLDEAAVTSVDIIVWHQGEGDNSAETAALYASQMDGWLGSLQTAGYITADTPFIMGQIGPANGTFINPALQEYADDNDRVGLAMIRDLEIADPETDNAHFTGESLTRAALEYMKALSATDTIWKNVAGVLDYDVYGDREIVTIDGDGAQASVPRKDVVPQQRRMVARGVPRQDEVDYDIDIAQNSSTLIPLTVIAGNPYLVQAPGHFRPDRPGLWKVTVSAMLEYGGLVRLYLQDTDGVQRLVASNPTTADLTKSQNVVGVDYTVYGPADFAYLYCLHDKAAGITLTADQAFAAFTFEAEYIGP